MPPPKPTNNKDLSITNVLKNKLTEIRRYMKR